MKNKILFIIACLLISTISINADCKDEELNEWATKVTPTFTKTSDLENGKYGYSYFLSVSPMRDDIVIKVVDGKYTAEGQMYGEFYGVGCYTNVEEKTYTIMIYGGEKSKCKNELLKKTTYTVPMFNKMIKEDVCEKYPDSEYCEPYTNKAKGMTQEEFKKAVEKNKTPEKSNSNRLQTIISYLLYIIIPFIIVSLIYYSKKKNIKKKGDK